MFYCSTYRCKNVEKVDKVIFSSFGKKCNENKKKLKFYHRIDINAIRHSSSKFFMKHTFQCSFVKESDMLPLSFKPVAPKEIKQLLGIICLYTPE